MDTTLAIIAILGAVLAGAMTPGASFVLVCQTAMAHSRAAGLSAAFGMGLGGSLFALVTLLGLATVLTAVPALHLALQLIGGFYLLVLAWRIWRSADQTVDVSSPSAGGNPRSAFWIALTTQLSNPKTAIVYASIFTALLPATPSATTIALLVFGVFLVEFGWYALVAVVLSMQAPRQVYARWKPRLDRAIAGLMGVLAGRLIWAGIGDRG